VHPRLAVNSLSAATWRLEQDLELCADLGVAKVSLFLDKAQAVGVERARDLLAGFEVTQVFAKGFVLHDEATWAADRARLREGVALAAELGCPWFGLTAGEAGRLSWDEAADALGRAVEPLRVDGVRFAVEHSLPVRPEVGFVHSLAHCVELADRLDMGATMEVTYCFNEREVRRTIADAAGRLATVQVSDLVPPSTVLPDRAVPGDGIIPLADLIGTAVANGYAGPIELEMLGPRVEAEGYEPAIRRAVAALDDLLAEVAPA
jgi:sugar phosphate isomerase/epimerase